MNIQNDHLPIITVDLESVIKISFSVKKMRGAELLTSKRKMSAKMICSGADHSMFKNVVRSIKRWASTDIKLTISPTVEERFASLVITRDCRNRAGITTIRVDVESRIFVLVGLISKHPWRMIFSGLGTCSVVEIRTKLSYNSLAGTTYTGTVHFNLHLGKINILESRLPDK